MMEIQKFMGLEQVLQPKDFVFNEDRGMYCLMRPGEDSCSKLPQTKVGHKLYYNINNINYVDFINHPKML